MHQFYNVYNPLLLNITTLVIKYKYIKYSFTKIKFHIKINKIFNK